MVNKLVNKISGNYFVILAKLTMLWKSYYYFVKRKKKIVIKKNNTTLLSSSPIYWNPKPTFCE